MSLSCALQAEAFKFQHAEEKYLKGCSYLFSYELNAEACERSLLLSVVGMQKLARIIWNSLSSYSFNLKKENCYLLVNYRRHPAVWLY